MWGARSPTHRHNNNRQTMDNKDLITRFAEDRFRFEALHEEIDSLIADADSEVLAYEYEDLANQAAEIVLKLSANGNNVGENFYRYYVERLEYIIDYFRALLDYEETPLAEDEPNELDDENDTQAAESDEAADDTTAGAPISDEDILRLPYERPITGRTYGCWEKLSSKERTKVRARETLAMWCDINDAFRRKSGGHDYAKAYEVLDSTGFWFYSTKDDFRLGLHKCLFSSEKILRKKINKVIDAIPGFRDSEKFKELIEQYPTYKEKEQ